MCVADSKLGKKTKRKTTKKEQDVDLENLYHKFCSAGGTIGMAWLCLGVVPGG